MKKTKKLGIIATAVASLMAIAGLAACGGGDGGGDNGGGSKTKINFWGWGDVAEQANFQTLVNKFNAENDDIVVNYTGNTASAHMAALNKKNAKNLPELFMLSDYDFYEYARDGKLMDITEKVSEDDLSKVWPQAVAEYYYNPTTKLLGKGEGSKLYGLPKDLGPFTLVYNVDLLKSQAAKNGITDDELYGDNGLLNPNKAMTWSEFTSLLKRLQTGLPADNYAITHYELEAAIYSNDADFFDEGAVNSRITEQNFIDALQFCRDLDTVHHVMTPEAGSDVNGFVRFTGGKNIFSFMGPWDCAQFWSFESVTFQTDILPVPYNGENENAKSTAWVGSMAYCVGSKTNSAKAEAAIKLAKYLSLNVEAQRTLYALGQQVPNVVEMANDEWLNDTQNLLKKTDKSGNLITDKDGKYISKDPITRSVWLDTINGFDVANGDKIGGKIRSRYYTYHSGWYSDFTDALVNKGFWKGTITAQKFCTDYNGEFQSQLTRMRQELGIK